MRSKTISTKSTGVTALLDEQMPGNREVDIIRHSVEHLRRASLAAQKRTPTAFTLEPDFCDVRALFEQLIHEPRAPLRWPLRLPRVRRCAAFLRQNPYP